MLKKEYSIIDHHDFHTKVKQFFLKNNISLKIREQVQFFSEIDPNRVFHSKYSGRTTIGVDFHNYSFFQTLFSNDLPFDSYVMTVGNPYVENQFNPLVLYMIFPKEETNLASYGFPHIGNYLNLSFRTNRFTIDSLLEEFHDCGDLYIFPFEFKKHSDDIVTIIDDRVTVIQKEEFDENYAEDYAINIKFPDKINQFMSKLYKLSLYWIENASSLSVNPKKTRRQRSSFKCPVYDCSNLRTQCAAHSSG